jgi:hypothetical protein
MGGCGVDPVVDILAAQLINLTLYIGQHVADSVAMKTVEAVLDKIFSEDREVGLKIKIDANNPGRATAEKLCFKRQTPPCELTLQNVPLMWDEVNKKWRPDPSFYEQAMAACGVG